MKEMERATNVIDPVVSPTDRGWMDPPQLSDHLINANSSLRSAEYIFNAEGSVNDSFLKVVSLVSLSAFVSSFCRQSLGKMLFSRHYCPPTLLYFHSKHSANYL